ncbi:MAG TPA: 2'-5' RNA ligase family protein [Candidatus Dormibacteraeota bacterium]|nr:2'-5' RNA ligase family protein [Candidatus Dormibacteraeota bacterium]
MGEFRQRHDPSARAGVPPHITLMYPFLEPDRLSSEALTELEMSLEDVDAFEYSLTDARDFGTVSSISRRHRPSRSSR